MITCPETSSPIRLVTPERAAALDTATVLLDEVDAWLAYSPNNPNYPFSDAYRQPKALLDQERPALVTRLATEIGHISFQHAQSDVEAMASLPTRGDIFSTHHIAYAGIEAILAQFRACGREAPTEVVRSCGVNVIGATLVRMHYLSQLAERHPGIQAQFGVQPFKTTYRQNIISALRQTSLLEQHTLTTDTPRPDAARLAA